MKNKFKIGDKVICIDNDNTGDIYLTIDKQYIIKDIDMALGSIQTIDNRNDLSWYIQSRFTYLIPYIKIIKNIIKEK